MNPNAPFEILSFRIMVNLPPPESDDRQPSGPLRDNDEAIAVAIAFLSIGAILWWGLTRGPKVFTTAIELPQLSEAVSEEADSLTDFGDAEADTRQQSQDRGVFQFGAEADRDASAGDSSANIFADPDETRRDRTRDLDASSNLGNRATPGAVVAPTDVPGSSSDDIGEGTEPITGEADPAAPEPLPELSISDVPQDHWAYPYIVSLFEQGLLPDLPSGQLRPDQTLTRAEFAALLNSSFVGDEPGQRQLSFSDVSQGFWAQNAISQVVDAGYMTGYPGEVFRPEQQIPRYQVFVTMANGLELSPPSDIDASMNRFQDTQEIPDWARAQVAASAAEGIIVNHPEPQQLKPQQPATRAEIIAIIHEALVAQGRVEPVETPYSIPAE